MTHQYPHLCYQPRLPTSNFTHDASISTPLLPAPTSHFKPQKRLQFSRFRPKSEILTSSLELSFLDICLPNFGGSGVGVGFGIGCAGTGCGGGIGISLFFATATSSPYSTRRRTRKKLSTPMMAPTKGAKT